MTTIAAPLSIRLPEDVAPELGAELLLDEPSDAEMFELLVQELLDEATPSVSVLRAAIALGHEPCDLLSECFRRLRAGREVAA